jgi:phospholipid/cholesterol/gamma-HCH transport system substrate-binding protein
MNLTAKSLQSTVNQIGNSTNQLANTLGNETLPQLHTLTQNMNRSVLHFNRLIDGLDENPQSIIFGKPTQPAGPGEEGFNVKP